MIMPKGKYADADVIETWTQYPNYFLWLKEARPYWGGPVISHIETTLGRKICLDDYCMIFGKHKGKTIPEIKKIDSGYLKWLHKSLSKTSVSDPDATLKNKQLMEALAVHA